MTETRPFDPGLFNDAAIDPDTAKLNAQMVQLLNSEPEWWIVGAEAMRAARRRGEGPFPAPVMSSRARTIVIAGKHGNEIPLRVIAPAQPRGIYLHLHGGGWVLGGADMQEPDRPGIDAGRHRGLPQIGAPPAPRGYTLAFLKSLKSSDCWG
jgi:acetyl esterase